MWNKNTIQYNTLSSQELETLFLPNREDIYSDIGVPRKNWKVDKLDKFSMCAEEKNGGNESKSKGLCPNEVIQ